MGGAGLGSVWISSLLYKLYKLLLIQMLNLGLGWMGDSGETKRMAKGALHKGKPWKAVSCKTPKSLFPSEALQSFQERPTTPEATFVR